MYKKIEGPHKTSLLLDLDETVFLALSEKEFELHGATYQSIRLHMKIHYSQALSMGMKHEGYYFFVLNPERLKAMIEQIYVRGDDIIIFTAGLWKPEILHVVSRLCNLDKKEADKFHSSIFLNPQHDSVKLGYQQESVRNIAKAYRLHGLFRPMEVLRSRYYVFLDNDPAQIKSCEVLSYVQGVRATTDSADKSFYAQVLQEMTQARSTGRLSPDSSVYFFPEVILKTLMRLHQEQLALKTESPNI